MTYHEKQIVSLRLAYMGGYTYAFQKKVAWLLANGFSIDELYSRCVDDQMKQLLTDVINGGDSNADQEK